MKGKQTKINNSYESELSSSSGLSSVEENVNEYRSFNEVFPKLQQMLKPRLGVVEDSIKEDAADNGKIRKEMKVFNCTKKSSQEYDSHGLSVVKNNILNSDRRRITNNVITSSQESDFIGFSADEISNNNVKINCTIASSQESEFAGFSDDSLEINNGVPPTYLPIKTKALGATQLASSEVKLQLPSSEKLFSKVPKDGTVIFEIITENSCNAVDMKMSNKIMESGTSARITFNGAVGNASKPTPIKEIGVNLDSKPKTAAFSFGDGQNNEMCKYANERSPDLFDDDDEDTSTTVEPAPTFLQDQMNDSIDESMPAYDSLRKDRELLRRIQNSLAGIPPPPSVTIMQIDMFKSVENNKEIILNFFNDFDEKSAEPKSDSKGLFKPSHSFEEVQDMKWPNILNARHHGLCYNSSTYTEKIEYLSLSVVQRYVGAETGSSFQCSPSSAKKRNARIKMLTQSPGNRLSHLARRRAIFSSANLQCNSQKVTQNNRLGNKQILLDNKKSENRRKQKIITPKRRTPGERKLTRKTPTSSAKKRLLFRPIHANPAPSRETSKRALFQSPQKAAKVIIKPVIKPEIANRVEKSKRALFSPEKSSTSQQLELPSSLISNAAKRQRLDSDTADNSSKILRLNSISAYEGLTPRSLKLKSQSFCVGSSANIANCTITGKSLFRNSSDTVCSSQLSESHKKKLLWAVSQALQGKQIGVKHPSFKQYASVLARVVKRMFLENFNKSGSTSDTLLRLAKKYVFWVIQGKTADDIYLQERAKLELEKTCSKLTGYIAPADYENRKAALVRKCSNNTFFSENSMDTFNLSQSFGCANITQNSQSTEFLSQMSQESKTGSAIKLTIPSLQSSSSKSNLHGIALRENIDGELRRSAQKNFTGKDQSNLSPYSDKVSSSAKKHMSSIYDANSLKVKRQISFDS